MKQNYRSSLKNCLRSVQASSAFLTYLTYGLSDKTGFGLIPAAGYNTATGEPCSAGPASATSPCSCSAASPHSTRAVPSPSSSRPPSLPLSGWRVTKSPDPPREFSQ